MLLVTVEVAQKIKEDFFPHMKGEPIFFHISQNVLNFMCDNYSHTIFCPLHFSNNRFPTIPAKYTNSQGLVSVFFHEMGHLHDNNPTDTFEQLVDAEEFAQKWAIAEAKKHNDVYVKILLAVFHNWKDRDVIDDPKVRFILK